MNYILKDKKIVRCEDIIEWSNWFSENDRHVGIIEKEGIRGDSISISTVFLGISSFSSFMAIGKSNGLLIDRIPPGLFETMIFGLGGPNASEYQVKHDTWEEAETHHKELSELLVIG